MTYLVLVGIAVVVVAWSALARRRRTDVPLTSTGSISTVGLSKRQTAKTRAALAAATDSLR